MGKERAKGGRGRTEGSPKARGAAMESKENSKGKGKEKATRVATAGSLFIKV